MLGYNRMPETEIQDATKRGSTSEGCCKVLLYLVWPAQQLCRVNTLRQSEELRRTCPVLLETCSSEVLRSKAFCHLDSYRDGDEEDEE